MVEKLQKAIQVIPEPLFYAGAAIGIFNLGTQLLNFSNFLYKLYFQPKLNLIERYGKGSWALITGGGAGIGEEFCYQLAKLGFNIVILGRGDNIKTVAKQVEQLGVSARYIKADLLNISDTIQQINQQTNDIDISLLVNNAGIIQDPTYFHNLSLKLTKDIITTNGTAPITITRELIPRLLKRSDKSGIIFIGAASGVYPTPFWQIYSGVKSQIKAFSLALAEEYRGLIDVEVCCPAMVRTKMISQYKGNNAASVEECVAGSLRHLGRCDVTKGAISHEWQFGLFDVLLGTEGFSKFAEKMYRLRLENS